MTRLKVIAVMIAIEPTSEFSKNGCTRPLHGSKYQKLLPPTPTRAAPEIKKSIAKPPTMRIVERFF
jgi:hypothetical protein